MNQSHSLTIPGSNVPAIPGAQSQSIDAIPEGVIGYGSVAMPKRDFKKSEFPFFANTKDRDRRVTLLDAAPTMYYMHYVRVKNESGEGYNQYMRCTKKATGYCPICDFIEKYLDSYSGDNKKLKGEIGKIRVSRRYFTRLIDWELSTEVENELVDDGSGLPAFKILFWRFGDDKFSELGQKSKLYGKIAGHRDIFVHRCKDDRDVQFQKFSYDVLPAETFIISLYRQHGLVEKVKESLAKHMKEYDVEKIWGKIRTPDEFAEKVDYDFYVKLLSSSGVQVQAPAAQKRSGLSVPTTAPAPQTLSVETGIFEEGPGTDFAQQPVKMAQPVQQAPSVPQPQSVSPPQVLKPQQEIIPPPQPKKSVAPTPAQNTSDLDAILNELNTR